MNTVASTSYNAGALDVLGIGGMTHTLRIGDVANESLTVAG